MHSMGIPRKLSSQDLMRSFNWPPAPPPKTSLLPLVLIVGSIFLICPFLALINEIGRLISNPFGAFIVLLLVAAGAWFFARRTQKRQQPSRMPSPSPPLEKQMPLPPPPPPIPTDEEYEAWVKSWRNSARRYGIQKLGLDGWKEVEVDTPLYIRSIVWPDSDDASYYRSHGCPVLIKRGLDGRLHASVNRFTFFYPTEHYLAVFAGDVNALGSMRFERTRTYFYEDIVGVETSAFNLNDGLTSNVMQRFDLRVSSGQSISATTYVPDLNVEETVQALRTLLKGKKQGG